MRGLFLLGALSLSPATLLACGSSASTGTGAGEAGLDGPSARGSDGAVGKPGDASHEDVRGLRDGSDSEGGRLLDGSQMALDASLDGVSGAGDAANDGASDGEAARGGDALGADGGGHATSDSGAHEGGEGHDAGREGGLASDAGDRDAHADAAPVFSACGDMGGLQAGAPWPMRGRCPTRNARAEVLGPSASHPKWAVSWDGTPPLLNYAMILTTPVVDANGTVYVGFQGVGTVSSALAAVSSTGTSLWTHTTSAAVDSGPLVRADGSILAGSSDGNVFVVEAATGALRWSTNIGGIPSSPLVTSDGTIYVGYDNGGSVFSSGVAALDANGNILWTAFNGPFYYCDLVFGGLSLRQDGTIWMNCGDHLASMSLSGVVGEDADSDIPDFMIGAPLRSAPMALFGLAVC